MSYVRCSRCQCRRTLAKSIDKYVRLPPCRRCGRNRYYVDHYRTTKERGKGVKACYCHRLETHLGSLYWFPHRRGSRFCGHASFTVEEAKQWAQDRGLV